MTLIGRSIHLVFLTCVVFVMVAYFIPRSARAASIDPKVERGLAGWSEEMFNQAIAGQ